jgi:L-ascorbate metabolism protein UlaG (beta-lactamase superfamily)
VQITRFGHAAVLVEVAETRILVDPGVFSPDATFALEGLDAIVVTHQHADHIDPARGAGLVALNPNATLICDPETAATLTYGSWMPNSDGLAIEVKGATVTGVGSQHAVIVPALPRVANVGVLITAPDEPVLFLAGDTYEYVPDRVDVLGVPLAAPWGKISETVEFVQRVAPRVMFPVHDCTIADIAYGMYWGHLTNFGGVEDGRKLGQDESTTVSS